MRFRKVKNNFDSQQLIETSREQKAKRFFKYPDEFRSGKKVIETFAILTANNPNLISYDRKSNDKFNSQLKDLISHDNPEDILKQYYFNYYKVKGKYGNKEDSFLIYNLTLQDAKTLATRFQQQSFIFGKNTDDGLVFEFWANKSKSGYVYAKIDEKTIYRDEQTAQDLYTQISRDFKFSIPFDRFAFTDKEMMEKLYSDYFTEDIYRENFENNLTNSLDDKYTFLGRVQYRCKLTNKG